MAEIVYGRTVGDRIMLTYDDGATQHLYPAQGTFWVPTPLIKSEPEPEPEPEPDPDPDPVPSGEWYHPLPGSTMTSPFGPRGLDGYHYGIDFANPAGRNGNVLSVTDMRVTVALNAGQGEWSAGTYVKGHSLDEAYTFAYYHMVSGSLTVKVGDVVKAGKKIGVEGATGNVTGQHLHIEMFKGKHIDPWYTSVQAINPGPIFQTKGIKF